MTITWRQSDNFVTMFGQSIPCSCLVRNELNKLRNAGEIVNTLPGNVPYMPRIFPVGKWAVGRPRKRTSEYLAPYFIPTDAFQMVDEWDIRDGMYVGKTGKQVMDSAYGLHFSPMTYTLGCVRIHKEVDLLYMVDAITAALDRGEVVYFDAEA